MKFVCHSCKSKYTISDEKVKNKRLKIRCKKCDAIIEVTDPAVADRISMSPSKIDSIIPPNRFSTPSALSQTKSSPQTRTMTALEEKFAVSFENRGGTASSGRPDLLQRLAQMEKPLESAPAPVCTSVPPHWEVAENPDVPPAPTPQPKTKDNRIFMVAAVAFFITALITLGVVVFSGILSTGNPQPVKTVEKIVEKIVYRDRVLLENTNPDRDGIQSETLDTETEVPASGRNPKKTAPKRKPTQDNTNELMARMAISTPNFGPPLNTRPTPSSTTASNDGTDGLSAEQLKRVVNTNKGSLKNCYERSLKNGEASDKRDLRVNFKVTVGTAGMVNKVVLSGDGSSLSSLNQCLTQSVKRWVFPASKQASNLEFPFVFTPTG